MQEEEWLTDTIFIVKDFFTPEECEEHIRLSEEIGYEDALLTSPQGNVLRTDIRNNQRVLHRDEGIAELIWERACDLVPTEYEGHHACGINELIRFYRYDAGQQFEWHQDFPFERDNGEQSYLTLMIYLNDDFEGGETSFDDSCSEESFDAFQVTPKKGMALFFEHGNHHKGEPVTQGRKYVLRTDVMYAGEEEEEPWAEEEEGW